MYYSITISIRIGLICNESAWIGLSVATDRDLSPSIALKRKLLAVDLTVSSEYSKNKPIIINGLYVPETIEWE